MASWHADFVLDGWRVSPKLNRIVKDGQTVGIKHKSMEVLVLLADAEGEVLSRDEIMDAIWPGMAVTDDVLTQAVHDLRHGFGDDPKHPRIIETIPRVGFRLIAPVTEAREKLPDASPSRSLALPYRRHLVVLLAIIVMGALLWTNTDRQDVARSPVITTQDSVSVAVLPFANRSNIAEDAFFIEGMQDDLLTLLSKLSSVEKVISRTSTEAYRDTTKSIPQIGKELGVAAVLEGAVRRSGNQVRINVQLIDTETEKNLWADTYDKVLTAENLFGIQSAIAREIVAALHGVLTEQENEALQVTPTDSLAAYAEYVLGRHEMAKRTGDGILSARTHFESAIELDPDYALAYVSLAETYELQPEYLGTPVEDILVPAQAAIDRALSIDPLSGEAYTSLAGLRQLQQRAEESERYYLRAIELSPGYATAYHWYYTLLWELHRFDEAHVQLARAIQLDPMAPVLMDNLVLMYLTLGRHQEAKTTILAGLERHPGFPALYIGMAELLWDEGQLGDALRWAQAALKLDSSSVRSTLFVCGLYLALGDDQSANACFEAMNDTNLEASTTYSYSALLYRCRLQFGNRKNGARRSGYVVPAAGTSPIRYLAWSYVVCGDLIGARSILEDTDPTPFGDDVIVIDPINIFSTVAAAYTLYVDGERDRADYLFDQALETMRSMRRTGWLGYRLLDVFIHVTRGDRQSAILALRDAVESGWRSSWWELHFPHFASMQDDPEWMELVAEIEADVRQQRQWFEEHKDDPLF